MKYSACCERGTSKGETKRCPKTNVKFPLPKMGYLSVHNLSAAHDGHDQIRTRFFFFNSMPPSKPQLESSKIRKRQLKQTYRCCRYASLGNNRNGRCDKLLKTTTLQTIFLHISKNIAPCSLLLVLKN